MSLLTEKNIEGTSWPEAVPRQFCTCCLLLIEGSKIKGAVKHSAVSLLCVAMMDESPRCEVRVANFGSRL